MDPALITALIASATGAVSAFVGYWYGYGNAERQGKREAKRLRAIIIEQQRTSVDLADQLYYLKARDIRPVTYTDDLTHAHISLSVNERVAFDNLVQRFRDSA